MEPAKMVDITEKIELAKHLGLKKQVSDLEYKAGMFDLKFKPITYKEIFKRLCVDKWEFRPLLIIYSVSMIGLGYIFLWAGSKVSFPAKLIISTFYGFILAWLIFQDIYKHARIVSCWVDDFQGELPYGAMLALKEAGEKGIKDHRIYYPTFDSVPSIKDDPIITGKTKSGVEVEIYAWNENDIYTLDGTRSKSST